MKLADCDQLLRFIEKNRRILDPNTNVVIGILPQAFELRQKEIAKGTISAGWVELFDSGNPINIYLAKKDILACRNKTKYCDVFALGNVADIKKTVLKYHQRARIIFTPSGVRCHASVLTHDNNQPEMLNDFANNTWCRLV